MSDNISILKRIINGKPLFLTTRRLLLFLLITGIFSCLQFVIVGLIGVIRGYSIQSPWPQYIVWAWIICVLLIEARGITLLRHIATAVILIFLFIPMMLTTSEYYTRGLEYYQQGRYDLAISEFREETETWYRRLAYNWSEAPALMKMAESYCQLENYDKAREIYLLVQQRYPDYGASAATSIKSLDSGLEKVKEYDALPADKKNDISLLYDLALAYRYDLHCHSKALDIYIYVVSLPVDDRSKELAKKAIQQLATKENK